MTEAARPSRWRGLSEVTGSAITALLVFGAIPAVLIIVVGDPLSHGLGYQWGHPARVSMTVLAIVAWVAWVACSAQLIRAVVHHVRRGHVGVLVDAPMTDRIAARIAIGILILTSFGAPLAVVSGAGAAAPTTTSSRVPGHAAPAAAPAATPEPMTPGRAVTAPVYVVRPGDSLWSIADEQLGDGADWTAIAALNLGKTMADGLRVVDPSLIRAGWDLTLPAAAIGSPTADAIVAAPTAATTQSASTPSLTTPLTTPVTALPATVTPVAPVDRQPTPSTVASPAPADPTTTPATTPASEASAGSGLTADRASTATPHGTSSLPELLALGLGAIGCAALARRARRRRLLHQWAPRPSDDWPPSERAIDTDVLLQRFDQVPALAALEAANCYLGQALHATGDPTFEPAIRAICVGPSGVSFWLAAPGQAAPPGFDLSADGRAWLVPYGSLESRVTNQPYVPIVLPVGEDDHGTWLVPLRAGTCLPIVGPAALELWQAMRPVQEAWAWADMVVVTDDPQTACREVERFAGGEGAASPDDVPLLFFGDPGGLPGAVLRRLSVVTLSTSVASDLTVLVDHQAATIHPLGHTVRPHLVTQDTARLLHELVQPPAAGGGEVLVEPAAEVPPTADTELPDPVLLEPGVVEVKLLTMTPRLDGLDEPLPPNRARRAVELVAYLALQRPDVVTSDRLRNRVLGSADVDAAAKTLFNTATAARRAMGADEQGAPLLPPGTRSGHYRVSDAVTVDVQRAAALAALGNAAEDPDHAIAHLRAALALVEGEPLANALSGYTWWESEGHGARLAAVLVNAACNLAALAVSQERFDLAHWGIGQARLVDTYSESLSRAAMQVAAAAGDADQLRREWRECQRRVDELDPGSSPSPRTERLYGELAQQVLV